MLFCSFTDYFHFVHRLTIADTSTTTDETTLPAVITTEETKKESKNRNAADDSVLKCVVQQASQENVEGVYKKALGLMGRIMLGEKEGDIPRNENFM